MRSKVKAQDFAIGAEHLKMTADQGLVRAQFYVSKCLLNGQCVFSEAVRYFQMAAENALAV